MWCLEHEVFFDLTHDSNEEYSIGDG
jgi:hypothetical protein